MPHPRITHRAAASITAAAAVSAAVLLARALEFDRPPALDRRVRRIAQWQVLDGARTLMAPLFPLGLPGGFITISYVTAHWLRRRGRHSGPAIVTAAWLGWLVHRAVKIGYRRERPLRIGVKPRTDSYPSGHTTGTTALALTTALVLHRERLVSMRRAAAIGIGAPALMGAYRVIADDHWATDVVGGWLVGGAIALVCSATLAEPMGGARRRARETESRSSSGRRRGRPERPSSKA